MNILHLHTGLNLTCGISKTIYLIAKYPVKEDKHYVIAINGDALEKFEESKINIRFLNHNGKKIIGIFKTISYLIKFIKANDINILHSHHRSFDFVSYVLSFFCKIKRVTSVQSFVFGKKLLSYKSPVLLAAGESVKKHLIEYFKISEKRIIVFNNFVDTNEVKAQQIPEEIKKKLNIPENSYLIGYIGRFSIKEKGIDILIDAFNVFREKYKNVFLVMVGSGEDIEKIKIPSNVKILTPQQNIFDYYSIFDCIVLPSRVDPFPLTVLEAGMMRIPFIGADVHGIGEIINNNINGLLFEKENVNMLLEKMEIFYNERNFANICSNKLCNKIIKRYNCQTALEFLNCIYEKL
jgi:L-malate glycosyltransferase